MVKPTETYPGSSRTWRLGFIILSMTIFGLFVSQIVLCELTRQALLQSNWWFGSVIQFFGFVFILITTMLVGAWFGMIVVFGSTHPKHGSQYWQWVSQGFVIMAFIGICWAEFVLLFNNLSWPFPQDPFVLLELASASITYGIVGFTIAAMSMIIWWKWLKDLAKK